MIWAVLTKLPITGEEGEAEQIAFKRGSISLTEIRLTQSWRLDLIALRSLSERKELCRFP